MAEKTERNYDDQTRLPKKAKWSEEEHTNDVSIENPEMPHADELDMINIVTGSSNYNYVLNSYAFVDKTLHIRNIFKPGCAILFVAPFRCGKSTNMNMIRYFLEIEVDNEGKKIDNVTKDENGKWVERENQTEKFRRFRELNIYKCQHKPKHTHDECIERKCSHRNFFYENCGQHPVIYISFKDVTCDEDLKTSLKMSILESFLQHPYLGEEARSHLPQESRKTFSMCTGSESFKKMEMSSLKFLARYLQTQFQKKSFVLVEEYDAPITQMIHNCRLTDDQIESAIDTIGSVISGVLKDNDAVYGGLLNASMEVKGTLSRHANNVKACIFLEDPTFLDYFGFTEAELDELLKKPVFKKLDKQDIQEFYNGYKALNYDINIFNTYSVLMFLEGWIAHMKRKRQEKKSPKKEDCKPTKFWLDRGLDLGQIFKIDKIGKYILALSENGTVTVRAIEDRMTIRHLKILKKLLNNSGDVLTEEEVDLIFHYLKNRGYLYTSEKSDTCITLAVPNMEIQITFTHHLFYSRLYDKKYNLKPEKYIDALTKLDMNEQSTFEEFVKSIVSLFPQESWSRAHDELKGIMYIYAFANKHDRFSRVESEPFVIPVRRFRADLVIITKDGTGIVVEISSCNDDEEQALEKIYEKKYFNILPDGIKQKIYIGLHFNYVDGSVKICTKATSGKTPNKEITAKKFREFKMNRYSARRMQNR